VSRRLSTRETLWGISRHRRGENAGCPSFELYPNVCLATEENHGSREVLGTNRCVLWATFLTAAVTCRLFASGQAVTDDLRPIHT
jgi:hypothetical protein